jgi:hypothetical protein
MLRTSGLVFVIGLLVAGCAKKYKVDAYDGPATRLERSASFYVTLPKDAVYGRKTYLQSGQQTAQAAAGALAHYVHTIESADKVQDLKESLATAKAKGLTHVLESMIINWEDRATEWSGKTDKLTVKFVVYEVETGKPIASTITRASSPWGTFGGDHPQELLPHPTQQFVATLFR